MASMTSIISIFVLLLATYCYSLPVEDQFTASTSNYEFTTGTAIVDNENKITMRLMSDEESTDLPEINFDRSYDREATTVGQLETREEISRLTRLAKEFLFNGTSGTPESFSHDNFTFTTVESRTQFETKEDVFRPVRLTEEFSFNATSETPESFSRDNFTFTTVESNIEFEQRAMLLNDKEDKLEMTTNVMPSFTSSSSFLQSESNTSVPSSSSVDSFGKYTGLLTDEPKEKSMKFKKTRPVKTTEKKDEESTSKMPVKTERLTKTVSIIPGKVTKAESFPSESTSEHIEVEQIQLSQG